MSLGTDRSRSIRPSPDFVWPLRPPTDVPWEVWRTWSSGMARSFRWSLALGPLAAVAFERAHHRRAFDRGLAAVAPLELQPEFLLAEELREHLAAEGAGREYLVGLRIVLEDHRRERLWRGARHHARAGGRIVNAAVGAAGDHLGAPGGGARAVAIADEAHLPGGIGHLVRADRRVRDHRLVGAEAALPFIRPARP